MSLVSALRSLRLLKINITPQYFAVPVNQYAAPGGALGKMKQGKKGSIGAEKKVLPVEEDANKLVKFVCGSNIFKEGQDVEIKPDSEYPDWLWSIHTKPVPLEDLDPETKAYWRRLRKHGHRRLNQLSKTKKF